MRICIVTGGSGGHIYPALTYADYVKKHSNYEIFFIGNEHKMESQIIPEAGYEFYPIHNGGLQGSVWDKVKAVFSQFAAVKQALDYLKEKKPHVVFAFGAYVSAPVAMAAKILNIPVVLHEQNAYPGKANRMIARFSKAIITSYPEAFADKENTYYLGNPRASLKSEDIHSEKEWERLGLKDMPTVLIVMGSQGSSAMNPLFEEFIRIFNEDSFQVVLTTGPTHYEAFKEKYPVLPKNLHLTGFVDQKSLLPRLDLIVARAGASTIAEIQAFSLASILIPSPHVANNHQYHNAKSLYDQDACEMLLEKDLTAEKLQMTIRDLMADQEKREKLGKHASHMAKFNAVSDIHALIEKVVE